MPISKHQASFGYRETHDLPTPPATTRPSPPSSSQRDSYHTMPTPQRLDSPYGQPPISASHGRLPHPSSIGLQQQSQHPTQQPQHHQQQQQHQQQQHQHHQHHQHHQQQQHPQPPPPPPQASHQRPPHQNLAQNVQHGTQQSQHLPPPLNPSQHHYQGHDASQHRNPQSQPTLPHSQQLPPQQSHQQPPHTITQGPVSAPPPAGSQSGISHHHSHSMTRPYDQSLGALPAPPPQWQDSEDSMKDWFLAKTEEEKRRQEEEKTRQGTLRYEQRQIELEILRTSLSGGIPPTMIPLVFAGMGGITLPAGAMEWAEQVISSHHQHHGPQAPTSPGKRRESQPHSISTGTPNPMPPAHGFVHPGSPAVRSSMGGGPSSATRPISNVHASGSNAPNVSSYSFANQTGPEPHSGIYFHHWQPPSTQTQTVNNNTVSTQSSAPSVDSPKKRKASGPPSETRSPPVLNLPSSSRSSISTNANYSYTGGSGSRQRSSQNHQGHIKQRSESTTARDTSGTSSGGAEIMGPGPSTDRMNFAPQTQAKSQSRPPSSHSGPTPTPSQARISDARQAGSNSGNSSHTLSSLLADGLQVNQ